MSRQYFRFSLMKEKPTIKTHASRFHGIVLDAHILELFPSAISSFMSLLGKPYFLDPVLFKFGDNFFPDLKEKRWVKSLTNEYGLEQAMLHCPEGLDSTYILNVANDKLIDTIVTKTLDYQRDRLPNLNQSVSELGALSGEQVGVLNPPELLVSPYLVCCDINCLKANLKLLRLAIGHRTNGERIYGVVAITKDLLFEDEIQTILKDYLKQSPDGFLI
ncbi:MAG: hypothetical protein E4H14_19985, partial [Candidatus Thorarchaeota archaeon]